jgi:transcriptional regulator with XRE-family HTH domain
VPATITERLERLDEQSEALKAAFLQAAEHLDRSDDVPGEVVARLEEQAARVARLPDALERTDLDRDQLDGAWRALWEMRELLGRAGAQVDLDTLDELLVAVERFRHVIRDALDEGVPGLRDDTSQVVAQLLAWLPGVPRHELAELLGVDVRTLSRWERRTGAPPHRLALVAKLVAILRHAWTPEGVIAWFHRPRADLGGAAPLDRLEAVDAAPELVAAARGSRSMYAG